jgi:chromosomal replication initiation ATPase DnaA
LETELDPHTFSTWLRPTAGVGIEDDRLVVSVPNEVFRDWNSDNYAEQAARAAGMAVRFIVREADG